MARSSILSHAHVIVRESFYWPDQQLNLWILVMLATGGTLIGVFANFMMVQQQLGLGVPWIMPYAVTVGSLLVVFVIVMLALIFQRRLLPGLVIIGCFVLLVLFIAGFIGTAIQLFSPASNVSGACQANVFSQQSHGLTIQTLVWLEQNGICQSWYAAFAFWIIGIIFLIYMMVLASNVARGGYGGPRDQVR